MDVDVRTAVAPGEAGWALAMLVAILRGMSSTHDVDVKRMCACAAVVMEGLNMARAADVLMRRVALGAVRGRLATGQRSIQAARGEDHGDHENAQDLVCDAAHLLSKAGRFERGQGEIRAMR